MTATTLFTTGRFSGLGRARHSRGRCCVRNEAALVRDPSAHEPRAAAPPVPALLGQGQGRRPCEVVEAGARAPGGGGIMTKLVFLGMITVAHLVGATMASRLSAETATFETDAAGGPPRGWLPTMTGKGSPKWVVEKDEDG